MVLPQQREKKSQHLEEEEVLLTQLGFVELVVHVV